MNQPLCAQHERTTMFAQGAMPWCNAVGVPTDAGSAVDSTMLNEHRSSKPNNAVFNAVRHASMILSEACDLQRTAGTYPCQHVVHQLRHLIITCKQHHL